MSDIVTPNLPSRDFERTSQFYLALGFSESWRDKGWMILKRGTLTLEFFPHPDLDPRASWFSCCLRFDDLDAFYAVCKHAGIPRGMQGPTKAPYPTRPTIGVGMGAFVDPDGALVRLIEN
jgi:catechol 2,3-dioxygenase-like lactoylglutathione lyase family enzyme